MDEGAPFAVWGQFSCCGILETFNDGLCELSKLVKYAGIVYAHCFPRAIVTHY